MSVVEKAKGYITRYNGTITEVEEWGKKKLAYEIQKMHEGFYYAPGIRYSRRWVSGSAPAEDRHRSHPPDGFPQMSGRIL